MSSLTAVPPASEPLPSDIGTDRICDCPPKHLNCLTAKEWMKRQIGVWRFAYESRDVRDKTIHPATFPIALAKAVIELFTHRGELVLDPFVGSGTTLLAAQDLERNAVGYDLQPGYVASAQERLAAAAERRDGTRQLALVADARAIRQQLRGGVRGARLHLAALRQPAQSSAEKQEPTR